MAFITTFRDQRLSLLQSAMAAVLQDRHGVGTQLHGPVTLTEKKMLASVVTLGGEIATHLPGLHEQVFGAVNSRFTPAPLDTSRDFVPELKKILDRIGGEGKLCGALAFEYSEAKVLGDIAHVDQIEKLIRFSDCDINFIREISLRYVAFFELSKQSIIRHEWHSITDFTLDHALDEAAPAAPVRVAMVADWGTGEGAAVDVMKAIAAKNPDLVIHLGDIYYSGIMEECQNRFLSVYQKLLPTTPCYTLAGNHDMYSGGQGYYWLLQQLKQPASYFCLRNSNWQIIALDTGYHGHNPVKDDTWLEDKDAAWALDKINTAGARKTILLSHHQPFSAFELSDQNCVNSKLMAPFAPVMNNITAWFWGHEHRLTVYNPFNNLQRGRCIGHGAIPTLAAEKYTVSSQKPAGITFRGNNDLTISNNDKNSLLPIVNGVYARGFAMLTLNGANATVDYFDESDFTVAKLTEEF